MKLDSNQSKFVEAIKSLQANKEVVQDIKDDPRGALKGLGISIPEDTKVKVMQNSRKVVYFALPPQPEAQISDESLSNVAGGGSTVGTAGTALTVLSCASSVGSASSAEVSATVGIVIGDGGTENLDSLG